MHPYAPPSPGVPGEGGAAGSNELRVVSLKPSPRQHFLVETARRLYIRNGNATNALKALAGAGGPSSERNAMRKKEQLS
jgi:hypothetical protein